MQFIVESWIWYTFATGVIIARLVSRMLLFGSPKRLQYDDWIMGLFVMACYTVLIVTSNIVEKALSNVLPPEFDVHGVAAAEIQDHEYGSKMVVVVEQMQIAVIWACKACLLMLYHRLTRTVRSKENIAIRLLAAYVAFGFILMELLFFAAWCRPFTQYWAVQTKSSQCKTFINHRIVNTVFNLSSDLIMLCIALQMFIRSLLPLKRKLILCCIFSLSIFAILAAVLNKYYSFSKPYQPTWIFWYCREASTATLVANLPFTSTLIRKIINLGAFDEEHPAPQTYHSSRTAGERRTASAHTHHSASEGGTTSSVEKPSHTNNSISNSKESRSISLVDSLCAPKERADEFASENSQTSRNGLFNEAEHPQDFALDFAAPNTDPQNIDIERASAHLSPQTSRPVSHTPTR